MAQIIIGGATGWTGSAVAKAIKKHDLHRLMGAVVGPNSKDLGKDLGHLIDPDKCSWELPLSGDLQKTLKDSPSTNVYVDYTSAACVKHNVLTALDCGKHVVIGSSGLAEKDFEEIADLAMSKKLGVIAACNFSITAALAKRFCMMAAKYIPHREIVDYASAGKKDSPAGTTRELAEELAKINTTVLDLPISETIGYREARGARIGDTQVHSLRLPGYTLAFEGLFGLPDERLTIRHDAGSGATPYVAGTLLAIERVSQKPGLIRGLDTLLFGPLVK